MGGDAVEVRGQLVEFLSFLPSTMGVHGIELRLVSKQPYQLSHLTDLRSDFLLCVDSISLYPFLQCWDCTQEPPGLASVSVCFQGGGYSSVVLT